MKKIKQAALLGIVTAILIVVIVSNILHELIF
jgi:hypothetical protein